MPAEPPLTPEQQARFDDYYPEQITALSRATCRTLWGAYVTEEDAVAAASIGLLKAVRIHNPEVASFNTILIYCLRTALVDGLRHGAGRDLIRNKSLKSDKKLPSVRVHQIEKQSGRMKLDLWHPTAVDETPAVIEAKEQLDAVMSRLNWKDRELVYDRFIRQWSVPVIAWHRQRTPGAIRMQLARVMREAANAGVA
jgi:RNA polymerase sigma factor (sigma-70 family)